MRAGLMKLIATGLALSLLAGCNVRKPFEAFPDLLRPRADVKQADAAQNEAEEKQEQPSEAVQQINQQQLEQTATAQTPARGNFLRPSSATTGQTVASRHASKSGTISFTPVIGAPANAVQPLSRHLGSHARTRGLTILRSTSAQSDHILKGYFSAFSDGDKTTVAFVWDVLDSSGNRLHRIRGQEIAQGTATDPWEVVEAATMEMIAAKTISNYLSWRASSGT